MATETLPLQPGDPARGAIAPGAVVAERYRIDRPLSQGGMGAVFEATQLGLDRRVALKLLLPAFARDAKVRERFRREARSAASLSHPHIIQIHDYGISDFGPYIVMELVEGQSLRQLLRAGPLSPARAAEVIGQLCSAVTAAHDAGIVHRDLKPENILLCGPPPAATIKVIDFGIAKLRQQPEEGTADLTGSNVIGTPHYLAPEQCLGLELDARADVYALGVVLFEMLAGRVPFADPAPTAVMLQHVNAPPPRPRDLRPELPGAVESVILKALAKERADRYQTAAELAHDLRRAATEEAGQETPRRPPRVPAAPDPLATNVRPPAGKSRPRLAILPLRNLIGEPEIDYLGFALADSVITQLACVKSLIVRPSSAVERYRAETTEPRAVGRELQVDTILSGSYLRAGDLFRVNVQLVDVAANEVLWQERIDLKFDNVIALQDRICEQLVSGLQLNLSTGEQEALRQDHAPHPMAYECYLRGLACAETGAGHRQAVELLEGAVSLDPDYAPAWAALCGRYLKARFYLTDESLPAKAEAAIRKALELSPRLPAALFCLLIFHSQNQDLPNALKVCRRLLEVAPNSEYAYEAMGCAYEYAGLPDLALTLLEKANEINPTALPHVIGVLHIQKGDLAAARRSLGGHAPGHPESAYWLALVDYLERKPGEAAARLDELIARDRTGQMSEVAAALRGAIRGDAEESRRLLRRVTERELSAGGHSDYVLGQIYAIIGDTPECLARLRAAIKGGYANYPYLMSDPLYAPARAAAGFGEIAAEMQQARARLISNLILES